MTLEPYGIKDVTVSTMRTLVANSLIIDCGTISTHPSVAYFTDGLLNKYPVEMSLNGTLQHSF